MVEQENVKYVFMDVVGYSNGRTVEAQTKIIEKLNEFVLQSIDEQKLAKKNLLYLPTGDGMCICFVGISKPFDLPLIISLNILDKINQWNKSINDEKVIFKIRIGINENIDNIIIDINKKRNASGSGINMAQRIMDCADGNQIMLGEISYQSIADREQYFNKFKKYSTAVKHGKMINVYQYIDSKYEFLNSEEPERFKDKQEIKVRPSRFILIYSKLLLDYNQEVRKILISKEIAHFDLHIILIYTSLRIEEKINSTEYNSNDLYDEIDEYFENGNILFDNWNKNLSSMKSIYRVEYEKLLLEKYLDKYNWYFQNGSDYLQLSQEGLEYQKQHLENIDIKKYIVAI
jgi:hypothetical protein